MAIKTIKNKIFSKILWKNIWGCSNFNSNSYNNKMEIANYFLYTLKESDIIEHRLPRIRDHQEK